MKYQSVPESVISWLPTESTCWEMSLRLSIVNTFAERSLISRNPSKLESGSINAKYTLTPRVPSLSTMLPIMLPSSLISGFPDVTRKMTLEAEDLGNIVAAVCKASLTLRSPPRSGVPSTMSAKSETVLKLSKSDSREVWVLDTTRAARVSCGWKSRYLARLFTSSLEVL